MCDRKMPLSKLAEPIMRYPQYLVNLSVKDKKRVVNDPEVVLSLEKVEKLIDGKGRVLLRESGTEPVVRIMVESETVELCEKYADIIASIIKETGHLSE